MNEKRDSCSLLSLWDGYELKKKPFILVILTIIFTLFGGGILGTQLGKTNCPNDGFSNEFKELNLMTNNPAIASDPSPIPRRTEGSFQSAEVGIYKRVEDIYFSSYHWGFYLGIILDYKIITHEEIIVYGFVFMETFGFVPKMTTSLEFNSSIGYASEIFIDQGLLSGTAPDIYRTNYPSHIPLHEYPMCHYIVPRNLQEEKVVVNNEYRIFSAQFDRSGTLNEDRAVPVCREDRCAITFPSSVILIIAGFCIAIAISVWLMHWRTKDTCTRIDLVPDKQPLAAIKINKEGASKIPPQSLWKWRTVLFFSILMTIMIVPSISIIQINTSYLILGWPLISWYSYANDIAIFTPFWGNILKLITGLVLPVYVGLWNSFKTRQAIKAGTTIPAKIKQRTIWGLAFTLIWILSLPVTWFLNNIDYLERWGNIQSLIPLPAIIALAVGILLAFLTFNLPRSRPLDFRAWAPPTELFGPLSLQDEKSAQKLWMRRIIYTVCVWGILFGWLYLRLYFPYEIISRNIIVFDTVATSQIITVVFEYFLPLGLGIVSAILTWWNFTRQGRIVTRPAKLMGKASVAIFGFAVVSALLSAFNSAFSFTSWEYFLIQLIFIGGNLPALFFVWKLQQITFESATSKARDFRWPPAVPGQIKGPHRKAEEQPPVTVLPRGLRMG